MTVTATSETRKQYTGNSGYTTSTDFTASFKYLATSEIQVVHTNTSTSTDTTYVEGTNYTVTSGASADSVTIRFPATFPPLPRNTSRFRGTCRFPRIQITPKGARWMLKR